MQDIDLNKATQPYEYYMKHIKDNRRPDGRKLSEIRPCSIRVDCIQNTVNGSATVKLGSTTVICGIQARLFTPKVDRPDRGYLIPNVELPALCSSKNVSSGSQTSSSGGGGMSGVSGGSGSGGGGKSSQSIEQTQSMLSQLMLDVLTESACVDERALCLVPTKLAWALYIDLVCVNHDGNVQDACVLAMISALRTVRLPEVRLLVDDDETTEAAAPKSVDTTTAAGGENKIKVTYPLKMIPLRLACEPVCTTMFAIEDQGVILLADPNKLEEDFACTFLIICTVDNERICLMRKLGGGLCLTQQHLDLCISRAFENGTHIRKNVFNL